MSYLIWEEKKTCESLLVHELEVSSHDQQKFPTASLLEHLIKAVVSIYYLGYDPE